MEYQPVLSRFSCIEPHGETHFIFQYIFLFLLLTQKSLSEFYWLLFRSLSSPYGIIHTNFKWKKLMLNTLILSWDNADKQRSVLWNAFVNQATEHVLCASLWAWDALRYRERMWRASNQKFGRASVIITFSINTPQHFVVAGVSGIVKGKSGSP